MPKQLKYLPEPARSNETPEQLNDRLQHALQSMSAVRTNVTCHQKDRVVPAPMPKIPQSNTQFDNPFTNVSKAKIIKTPKQPKLQLDFSFHNVSDIRTKETPEQRKARLKRAREYLRSIRANETSSRRSSRIEHTRKKTTIVKMNETAEERDARLASALKCISEVKLYKPKTVNARPKCMRKKISEVKLHKESDNNDQIEHTQLAQTTVEISPEASKSTTDNSEFETLLCYFLKQEHKPPCPKKVKTIANTKSDTVNIKKEDSDTVKDHTHNIKTENVYDDKFDVDLEDPFRKIEVGLNAEASGDGRSFEGINETELNKKGSDPKNNALGMKIVNGTYLEESLLHESIDEINALHSFETCPRSNLDIKPDMKTRHENMVTVKEECDMLDAEHTTT